MNLKRRKSLRSSSRLLIVASLTLGLVVLLFVVITKFSYVDRILTMTAAHENHIQAQWHISKILRLEEALTMSVKLAVASGDVAWIERYQTLVRDVDKELLALRNLDPNTFETFGGQSTQKANDALIEIELRALNWLKETKRKDASALLIGSTYRRLKTDYLNGMQTMRGALRNRVEQETHALSNLGISLLHWVYLATVFFLMALLASTIVIVSLIEHNAKMREQSNIAMNQMVLAGELSSLVNHEFKNIITILDFPIRTLKKSFKKETNKNTSTAINKIQTTFLRFSELIRAFGSLGRPSDLKMGRVLVEDAVKDVIYFSEYLAKKNGIRFSIANMSHCANLAFYGNQVLLTHTLLNLIKNSCDALEKLPDGSKWVRLEVEEKDGLIRFSVVDGGNGLHEALKRKLFLNRVTTKGSSGTGLGLSISRKFTVMQGGKLEYEDHRKNTSFAVTLKAA